MFSPTPDILGQLLNANLRLNGENREGVPMGPHFPDQARTIAAGVVFRSLSLALKSNFALPALPFSRVLALDMPHLMPSR